MTPASAVGACGRTLLLSAWACLNSRGPATIVEHVATNQATHHLAFMCIDSHHIGHSIVRTATSALSLCTRIYGCAEYSQSSS